MIELSYPLLLPFLLISFILSFSLPFLEKKLDKQVLPIFSFILILIPTLTALIIYLIFGLEEGIVEPALFSHETIGSFSMYLDRLNALYLLGVGIVTPLVALYSFEVMKNRLEELHKEGGFTPSLGIFYLFYTIFALGMVGFVLTTNLFLQYIFLKLTLLSSFILIWFFGHGEKKRIGVIYLIWSLIGGGVFLLGILGLSAEIGTFNILDLSSLELNSSLRQEVTLLIPFLIFFGMCIKKALFGVHMWLPKAHAEAPAPVSALLSANLIGISSYVMIKVVLEMFPTHFEYLSPFFLALSFITMVYGSSMAIAQDDLKALLAYSSISQMGWITFGISTMTPKGISGGALLFVTQSVSSSVLFMAAGLLMKKYDGLRKISDMGGLITMNPVLSGLIILGFFTLVGAPFTIGFWAKTLVFSGATSVAAEYGPIVFILTALGIIFAGGITASYSFITLKRMLFGMFKSNMDDRPIGWTTSTISMSIIGVVGIFLFLIPEPLSHPAELPRLSVLAVEGMMFLTAYMGAYFIFTGGVRYYLVLFSHRVEEQIIDEFFHNSIPNYLFKGLRMFKKKQPGDLGNYLIWLMIGFIIILITITFG